MNNTQKKKIGVMLVNLGTPDAPTATAVRRFLAEFLRDRRVVEIPRLIWLPILYGLILPFRPGKVAHKYAEIWREDGSPLLAISREQAAALQTTLGDDYCVSLGMRYGTPDIESSLQALLDKDCNQVIVLPLYPQYSATTSATVWDAVSDALRPQRAVPDLHFVRDYHQQPEYIDALAQSVKAHWHAHGRGQRLLMSFHGIPQRNADLGDPYPEQCHATAKLLAQALELNASDWEISFQSRFGKAAWLQPYTSQTLESWPAQGISNVDIICPGFAADCLETLEEIQVENAEIFQIAGGTQLNYIAALNDSPAHIHSLAALVQQRSQGWTRAL